MAEAAFRKTVLDTGHVDSFTRIDSCGTIGIHAGKGPDSRMFPHLLGSASVVGS